MRVLIACEFSGIVRDAFIRNGHDAVSCDLIPSLRPGPHIIGNVFDVLKRERVGFGWLGSDDISLALQIPYQCRVEMVI